MVKFNEKGQGYWDWNLLLENTSAKFIATIEEVINDYEEYVQLSPEDNPKIHVETTTYDVEVFLEVGSLYFIFRYSIATGRISETKMIRWDQVKKISEVFMNV
jgi:tRNA U54 and U55 pseudouridine synthase Pus10